ncbi:MAG: hypothetical protein CMC82_01625 [Flavobacteriaceae bacterium]|nr:hypothetical protein [Flavobacteriaceae bacterium]
MPQPNRFVTARLSLRKGTDSEWENNNPVLLLGEPAINTTVNKFKIGDGVKTWSQLPYIESLGGANWTNDAGFFPEYIQLQDDAVDFTRAQYNILLKHAVDYFTAGTTGDVQILKYPLNVSASTGGAASISNYLRKWNTYDEGETVEITAVPFGIYSFSGWTGLLSGESDTATTTITMSGPRTLVATFTK